MRLSTQTLASASARHPWRTIGAWIAVFVLAIVAIVDAARRQPDHRGRADEQPRVGARAATRASAPSRPIPDTTVDRHRHRPLGRARGRLPVFAAFLRRARRGRAPRGSRGHGRTWTTRTARSSPRTATRRSSRSGSDEDDVESVVAAVEDADEDAAFAVAMTGDETLDHDFNLLSQEDLENGELQFGLPAALIILLLVFGAVVAGLVPLLMAIVSIVVALGLTALVAQPFELSIFVMNMLTGMGLALGIDYSLFVVSRYREERGARSRAVRRDRRFGADREPRGALQRDGLRRRDVRDAARPELDHAQPRGRRDPRRDRLGDRGADAAPRRARPARRPRQRAAHPDRRRGARSGGLGRALLGRDRPERAPAPGVEPRGVGRVLLLLALPRSSRSSIGTSGVSTLPDRFVSKQGFVALERDFPQTTTDPAEIVVTSGASREDVSRALDELRATLAADSALRRRRDRALGGRRGRGPLGARGGRSGSRPRPSRRCASSAPRTCRRHSTGRGRGARRRHARPRTSTTSTRSSARRRS